MNQVDVKGWLGVALILFALFLAFAVLTGEVVKTAIIVSAIFLAFLGAALISASSDEEKEKKKRQ